MHNKAVDMNPKRVLIIIPAYNEEAALQKLIHEVRSLAPGCDMVVINDGSGDHTGQVAEKSNCPVINLPVNLGIGGAMQTGFKYAVREGYDVAVQLDGDGQHDPSQLMLIIEPVTKEELDMCIGSRFLSHQGGFQSTFSRRVGIHFFCHLLSLLTRLPITDPTSGFRALSRPVFSAFAEYYPVDFPEPEAIMIAKRLGSKIAEVPVKMRERQGGISSIRYWKTLYYMVKVTAAILIDLLKKR